MLIDLGKAIFEENQEAVKRILDDGADINLRVENGFTPLMQACEMENIEIVKYLLGRGAKINEPGFEGNTALHIAVDISIDGTIQGVGEPGDEPVGIIEFLLSQGADISIKNVHGKTALDWAVEYNSKNVISVLEKERPENQ
jgi:ankyrin repeat protein